MASPYLYPCIAGGTPALLWGGMKSPFSGPIATSSAFGFLCEIFFPRHNESYYSDLVLIFFEKQRR